jgi:predicted dehydrogenase
MLPDVGGNRPVTISPAVVFPQPLSPTDVNHETAKKFVKEFGLATYFSDYKKLIEHKYVDAVIVSLPHSALAQVAIDSLKAGSCAVMG